jgi:uncharacterized protein YukE
MLPVSMKGNLQMSIFASAARCIASLANLGQQGAGLGLDFGGWSDSTPGAEGWAATGTNAAGDIGSIGAALAGKAIVRNMSSGARMRLGTQMGGKSGIEDFGKAVSIISWTITTVQLLQLTTGFGTPYEGNALKTGSQQFTTLAGQLTSALPDTGWQGDASQAYADLDTALQQAAQTMAELDSQLAALVKNQAEWVTHMQLAFGILNDVLAAALIIEMILTFTVPAPAGPIVGKAFAITVATLGISAAVSFLGTLLAYSIENGQKADALAASYSALATGIVQNDSVAQPKLVVAGQSTSAMSGFQAISANLSGPSATAVAPAMPPKTANDRAEQRPQRDVQAPAAPAAAAASDYTSAPAPTGTMPTLAQAAAMSGQASNLSGRVAQPESLMKQARGQVRQLAQEDPREAAAAPASEVHVDEGAAGYGAERAPVGAEAYRPGSVERSF